MYIRLFSNRLKIVRSFGSCVDVAGALVINDNSAFSFRGNSTSSTGVSGLISASILSLLPHPVIENTSTRERLAAIIDLILFS